MENLSDKALFQKYKPVAKLWRLKKPNWVQQVTWHKSVTEGAQRDKGNSLLTTTYGHSPVGCR